MARSKDQMLRMKEFLQLHRAATLRQLTDLLEIQTPYSYRLMREMRDRGETIWTPLEPERGSVSQQVCQLASVARDQPWTLTDLQLADTHLQALGGGWRWLPGTIPYAQKKRLVLPIAAAVPEDDTEGRDAIDRVMAAARELGVREISYTDHDGARAERVGGALRGSGIGVYTPWRSFLERPDPIRRPAPKAGIAT
jgi:hypothetical protein